MLTPHPGPLSIRLPNTSKCPTFDFGPLLPSLGTELSLKSLTAFVSAGLSPREAAIVAGVCGDVGLIVSKIGGDGDDDKYVNEVSCGGGVGGRGGNFSLRDNVV